MTATKRSLNIGIFGFGVVGRGLYEVLQEAPGLQLTIKKICVKDPFKERHIVFDGFTTNANDLLDDPSINVIVELIDDADAAFRIVTKAMENGKAVVSANKKMIAANFKALLALQERTGSPLLYEAACCASIPVIRNLEEYYDTDLLYSLRGIINGSTNFILTRMANDGLGFPEALRQAQQLGFAESDPALDIQGHDAANKLSLLLAHGFGNITHPSALLYSGITALSEEDCFFAREKNYKIRLVATVRKLGTNNLAAFILPQFVKEPDDLSLVSNEFNALIMETKFADRHFFLGKGAGALPTAAAVVSDLAALGHNYRYEYKKLHSKDSPVVSLDYHIRVCVSASCLTLIKRRYFEWIEEWHQESSNTRVIGIVRAQQLLANDWWRQEGVSLIACPDPIVENTGTGSSGKAAWNLPAGLKKSATQQQKSRSDLIPIPL